jgi:signal transduction histidine kinase
MQLQREPVRLAGVVARAMELYHDAADAKGVTLTSGVRVKPDAESSPSVASGVNHTGTDDVVVTADRTRLEQVAANLIDNAVKYTPPGGRVEVTVGRDGNRALLRVRDTGAGIPPDELPRIWDRLFRGDRSRAERGLGLGLSLVKAIVEAHGGMVDVESEPGRGSTFTVALPA